MYSVIRRVTISFSLLPPIDLFVIFVVISLLNTRFQIPILKRCTNPIYAHKHAEPNPHCYCWYAPSSVVKQWGRGRGVW